MTLKPQDKFCMLHQLCYSKYNSCRFTGYRSTLSWFTGSRLTGSWLTGSWLNNSWWHGSWQTCTDSPLRSDSQTTFTNSIHIGFFQLLCTSQLNFLGSIQTIIKADSTYPVIIQTDSTQFPAASTELNFLFT